MVQCDLLDQWILEGQLHLVTHVFLVNQCILKDPQVQVGLVDQVILVFHLGQQCQWLHLVLAVPEDLWLPVIQILQSVLFHL
jgi:hypothetical protein